MKKLFLITVITVVIFSCKATKVSSSATTGKPASDTALQGDSMKNPVKQ